MISREQRKRDLTRDRMRRLRERRRTGQAPPATDLPSDPEPGPEPEPETVQLEYVPGPPAPAPDLTPEAKSGGWVPPPGFDPYTQPIPGFEGDPNWLKRTQLGLDGTWADLVRLRSEGVSYRRDRRVVTGLARLKEAWDVYGETFEERTANGPYGKDQAAIWRWEIERLLTL